jgi:N-acetylneuraminic acid mutarotase
MRQVLLAVAGALCVLCVTSANADNWREAAPLEAPRAALQAVAVNGQIYAAGGSTLSGPSDVFEAYDPRSDKWRPLESMPEGRDAFGMAAQGGVVYVAGGYSSWKKAQPTGSVYGFDVAQGAWSPKASMPQPRFGHTMTAVGDYIYVIGGRGPGVEHVLRYDPHTDKWSNFGAPMPAPRSGHAAAALGTKIYLVGGRATGGDTLSRVDVFDTADGHWSTAASLPVAVVGTTASFVGSELNVAGGTEPALKRTLNDHYALTGGAWHKVAALPTPRQSLASAVLDGRWFVIGGGAGSGVLAVFTETDAVEVYSP